MDLIYVMNHLNTEVKCVKYLEKVRWGCTPQCPFCSSTRSSSKKLRHTCLGCGSSYSVKVGTVFENSNLPLTKWFLAISIILSAKKGVSSLQLSRDISVNKNTAWLLQFKIRKAMKEDAILSGIVEADETYIGGSSYNKHHYKRQKFKKGIVTGMTNKKPVLGMVERSGKVVAYAIGKAWGEEIMPILKSSINGKSTVVTDGFGGYYQVKNCFDQHQILKHEQNQFKRADFHTNTIEGSGAS